MPKFILYILLMLAFFPTVASAKVNVEISNNLEDSRNSVNIKSNTSTHKSNIVDNQTDIVINNNGEKKEYHGTGDGVIELKSDDGKSSVTVNNNSATNNPSTSTSKVTKTNIQVNSNTNNDSSPSASPSPEVAGVSIDVSGKEEKGGFWASIKKQLSAFFKLFS